MSIGQILRPVQTNGKTVKLPKCSSSEITKTVPVSWGFDPAKPNATSTHASRTGRTDSKIAGQTIFLAIATMTRVLFWDSRLCAFVSRGLHLFFTPLT
ncbi:hypothetical protein E2C01_036902 [Portunus trituberculatus]|uniref:Uncharacterized protein n=1 Tax=Portunus trituberculatus TaxID=210409 RepID=A0A5B7FDB1_PORTR|nr:hypothetical protein [Portunus trituberculatus]